MTESSRMNWKKMATRQLSLELS